ncbi:MAG: phage terminase large subunit family protein [Phycisphaeraceae bacterium]|nr:phage terminase large subunit family protein [Phycisphaeraceae bacterium]
MASIDPRTLRPADLLRLLNATSVGRSGGGGGGVLTEAQLRRHRNQAGYTLNNSRDPRAIDLFRYAAWLTLEYFNPRKRESLSYEEQKARQAERNAEAVRAAQDIGELPGVADPERKARCGNVSGGFRAFCETYFAEVFYLPWSDDHLRVIDKIERAVRTGGLFAMAMPRGSGKTVLCQAAVLWSALVGATPFVCLIAASAERARDLLENIKIWLETNPLLHADFPEVTYPIQCLERITNRQKGQKYKGEPTRIDWASDRIVLPTIAGSKASGVVISSSGMKGSDIRGQNYARADGQVVRPQLVLVDDPQTTESAWSPSQSQRREAILAGDVLGMAGPGKKIAGLMACTVIRPADMADNILDREKHPEWQGERTKMVYAFPSSGAEKLWAKYAEMRADSFRNDGDGREATEFYRTFRVAMDTGAIVAWPQRYNSDEISAIQHAMNLRFRDEAAFFAEYQNEPMVVEIGEEMLTPEAIATKLNGYRPGEIPIGCNHLTMFIDVQQKVLFWMLCAWEENFTGYLVDYGTWPDQRRAYFTLRDLRATLGRALSGAGVEGQIYAALDKLTGEKLAQAYRREDGAEMRIDRCLVDANWGQSTDVVYQFCRQSSFAAMLLPSHGKYIGASSIPFSEYKRRRGDRVGLHWRIPNTVGRRQVRHALIDTNYWKSFVHARLAVAMGDPGSLSLFGRDEKAHRLLADHLTAEYRVKSLAQGRTVDEWKLRATRPDNHWLDCLVGCAVGASIQGAALAGVESRSIQPRQRVRLSELQRGGR